MLMYVKFLVDMTNNGSCLELVELIIYFELNTDCIAKKQGNLVKSLYLKA